MPAPVVGAERGGASPGGEPAAHLEDARNPPSRGVPPVRRDGALAAAAAPDFGCDETSARVARREGRGGV